MAVSYVSTLKYRKPKVGLFRYWVQKVLHRGLPPVLCNSFPKSGTHLLLGILSQVTPFSYYKRRVFLHHLIKARVDPLRRSSVLEVKERLSNPLPGEIFFAHIEAHPEFQEILVQKNFKSFFIYRDLRDVVVSLFFMWKNGEGSDMWPRRHFFSLNSDADRLAFLISGWRRSELPREFPLTVDFPNISERFMENMNWLSDENTLSVKYEDLLSKSQRRPTLMKLAKYLLDTDHLATIEHAVSKMEKGFNPARSKTFRKGQAGDWQQHFTPDHKRLFKEYAGETLVELGYEKDLDW